MSGRPSRVTATPASQPALPTEPLLTIREVAALLSVSERTVHRVIAEGLLARHRVGRLVRISRSDVGAYLARRGLS